MPNPHVVVRPNGRAWFSVYLGIVLAGASTLAGCGSGASSPGSGDDGGAGTGAGGRSSPGAGGGAASAGTSGSAGNTGPDGGAGSGSAGSGAAGGVGAAGSSGRGGATGAAGASGAGGRGGTTGAAGASGLGGGGATGGRAGAGGRGGTTGVAGASGAGGRGGTTGAAGAGNGGAGGLGPEAPGGRISGYGTVLISANASHQIVRMQTTMVVPPEPPASGTLFLWPGIQPDGANFNPINNGVLQPVLTWGDSCAPVTQPRAYSTWWISGQYVNTNGSQPGYTGCYSGPAMSVNVGDTLDMDIALSGTVWTQTVTDVQTAKVVTYSIDMMNQSQNLAYFVIEEYSSAPVSEVIFTNSVITFGSAENADCKLAMRGMNDYVSVPVPSADGLTCSIQEIILRAQGIQ